MISARGQQRVMAWIDACMTLGWRREDIPALVDIWWRHHDDHGELFPPGKQRPPELADSADGDAS